MTTEFLTEFNGNSSYITQSFQLPLYYGSNGVSYKIRYVGQDRVVERRADWVGAKLFINKRTMVFGPTYELMFVADQPFTWTLNDSAATESHTYSAQSIEQNGITYYYQYSTAVASGFEIVDTVAINEQSTTSDPNQSTNFWQVAYLYYQSVKTNDPYELGGTSETGGGTGTFSDTGTDVDIPALPTLSATAAGFIRLYNPTLQQLNDLADYMWTGLFDLANFRKIFADPMDCILGLSIVPVAVLDAGSEEITIGNIGTGIFMNKAASQYVEVDCGSLNVKEYWGAYLDYDPFTKAEIYLPYIGTHALAVDDIMNKTVTVKYHIDILSGACVAYVKCGGTVLYSFNGQCSASIPVSKNDWTNVVNGVLSIAGSIGSMVATGGMSAPAAIPGIVSTASNSMKPSIEKSGSLSGTGGLLGIQTPYLILTRPRQAAPEDQNGMMGYPSFVNRQLGDLTGYTEVEEIHLEGVPATDAELTEIVSLLKGGVIL